MSYAILELHLGQPAATIHRVDTDRGAMWVVRCERCGGASRPRHLISNLLEIQQRHGADHVAAEVTDLEAFLHTEVKAVA